MPNRIIKESALDSEDLDKLSNGAERLFWRLVVVADDFGRFEGSPQVVKARCFPRKVDTLRTSEVQTWMNELEPSLVRFYHVNGRQYGFFINWLTHQQKRANKSKFPEPPVDNSPISGSEQNQRDSNCNHLQSNVSEIEIESEIENRDREAAAQSAAPVKVKELRPQTEADDVVRLAAEIGKLDKIETRAATQKDLIQWAISMMRKLDKEPPERKVAVARASLEVVRSKILSGYDIKNVWGLLDAIFTAERTKHMQGPEHQANKRPYDPTAIGNILDGIAKGKAVAT